MKIIALTFMAVLGLLVASGRNAAVWATDQTQSVKGEAMRPPDDKLIAIDILLEPDQEMIDKSRVLNARLRENFPSGYELDALHAPHVTLLQRFVREKDLDAVAAAVAKIGAEERPADLQLRATGLEYVVWGGVAVTALVVERTPELMRLQNDVTEALEPFSVSGGTAAAFVGGDANAETIGWVETFVPKGSGEN